MTADEFQDIISREAFKIVEQTVPRGEKYDKVRNAQLSLHMLVQGLRSEDSLEAALRWIVVRVAEEKTWKECVPDAIRWPTGFHWHTDFITEAVTLAACTSSNVASRLNRLANMAVFAQDNDISIVAVMNGSWTRLRDGLPAIGRALDVEDAEGLEEVLNDVQELSPAEFKDKYVTPRHKKAGTATVRTTEHGTVVLIAVLNGPSEIDRATSVVGGLFDWGLNAHADDDGRGVVIRIEGALSDVWTEVIEEQVA